MTALIDRREEIKLIAIKWLELVSKGDVEELCEMTDPAWTLNGGLPGLPPGPAGIRKLFESFGTVKQQWTINDVIAERDKVVVRATNRCAHDVFLGIKGHGRWQEFSAIFIHQIVNGKIVKTWRNADDLGRVIQQDPRPRSTSFYS